MRRYICILMLFFLLPFLLASAFSAGPEVEPPVSKSDWNTATKIWVARSCVGEAGFAARNECTAIAWVYRARSKTTGLPFLKTVRKYSAAIKRHSLHHRPWILELNEHSQKPKHWPTNLLWKNYENLWKELLVELDKWSLGEVPNLVPTADHFGSKADARIALYKRRWKRLKTPSYFKNWFFDSTRRTKKYELRQLLSPRAGFSKSRSSN